MNVVLKIAYDGTNFVGWQKTNLDPKKFPSIQQELETAIGKIVQQTVTLQAASRTDRGVHAHGQIVNFFVDTLSLTLVALKKGINALLPSSIRVLDIVVAPDEYHPTFSNSGKEYHYQVSYGKVLSPFDRFTDWHFPCTLDISLMQAAARILEGTHDFKAFRNERKGLDPDDTIRTISSIKIVPQSNERLIIKLIGNNFLYKMARNLAGTLIYVGCGKLPLDAIPGLVNGGSREQAGVTAPACGLHLHQIVRHGSNAVSVEVTNETA